MKTIIHKADTRGVANFGWLDSRHTFSFGRYFNPDRMSFGALRVLNDDIVEPGMGFGTHPHDNMEIVSIPLKGDLAHKDSTGNEKVIHTGEVQIMSAGSGLTHSEYNHSQSDKVNFLQIWVLPKEMNIKPRYDQRVFDKKNRVNTIQTVVAPDDDAALWINQNAWFSLATLDDTREIQYSFKNKDNGLYVFVIDGSVSFEDYTLSKRDGAGIFDTENVTFHSTGNSELLLIEVPLS